MINEVLVVEDDDFKLERLSRALLEANPGLVLRVAKSVHNAIEMLGRSYGLIVLDMALPSHTVTVGSSPAMSLPSGGIEVLLELAYAGRDDKVVVLTQYPEIEIEETLVPTKSALDVFREHKMGNVVAVLQYEPESSEWAGSLTEIARQECAS
ncbi:MAG: hypothetical protein KJ944_21350 [Alphaproteobacteria bacterium]|nr:hypothetical protein [Alphaproteobacteria bacterium]MBU1559759.1 hypothetical protein [Alphaproteobacteria bacterium]MBU2305138.1 hypothetical protein [Alphaproteobacteria bacterium]MBU2367943.1 hypothetical protein [Alphaproteobacteria bacterium]